MVGLKRRRKLEGWALADSEINEESRHVGAWQRLADNNKLWAACLIVVLLLTAFFYRTAKQSGQVKNNYDISPISTGSYDNKAHKEFTRQFLRNARYGTLVTDARFVGPETFRLTMKSSSSADDIDYISKVAAQKVLNKFKTRVVVQTYMRSSLYSGEMLIATAQWEPKKFGFVVKFSREASKAL